jgi:hypothetical protein
MKCEEVRQELPLFLYGELGFDDEDAVEEHLASCQACAAEAARQRALHAALDAREMEIPPTLLRRSRQSLMGHLNREPARRRPGFGEWFSGLFTVQVWRPATGLALLAAGFFGAQLMPVGGLPFARSASLVEPGNARVRYVEPAENGRVQIVVDETRERIVSGRLDDDHIRKLLLTAAKDPSDPGLRVESVEILKHNSEDDDVRGALIAALLHDSNSGVRLKALDALKPYAGQPEVRKALGEALLHDDNPGVRTQAVDLLTRQQPEDQMIGVLQELMRKEQNGYVRERCERVLRDAKASVEMY